MASTLPVSVASPVKNYPFLLGVASGSPRPDSIVLWTRIVSDLFNSRSVSAVPLTIKWEMADDPSFKKIVAKGSTTALPELAHSVHVDVNGLQPDRWYWYRFMHGDAISPIGHTRTAPAIDTMPSSLRLAYASCQHWEFGEYAAHRHIAASHPDLVAFLGDYIYEWGPYDLSHPSSPRRTNESFSLEEYRSRYAQYKSDPHLQAAHEAAPWIVTWDDHEVANDYANDRDERLDAHFIERRAAAYQAFYEHMPVRLPTAILRPDQFAHMRIYERYDWGLLARFHMLDNRQYRSYQACPSSGRGGSNSVTSICADRTNFTRTLLGKDQELWLANSFASSKAKWNFIGQQTLMAQSSQVAMFKPEDGRFWTDGWDGYPAARTRLFDDILKYRISNPIVMSGDVHTFYAADLKRDFFRSTSSKNPVIATEFCGTSITSKAFPQSRIDQYVAQNPHIHYGRSDRRGFILMDVTPKQTSVRFQALEDVSKADSALFSLTNFIVEDGRAGIVKSG